MTATARLWAAWCAASGVWGPVQPGLTLAAFATARGVVRAAQAVDDALGVDEALPPLDRPILIAGNPRTGSTFLHRTLHGLGLGVGRELWEHLVGATSLQRAIGPLLPSLGALNPGRFHDPAAHEIALDAVETDDAALLFGELDGMFLFGFFLAWAEADPSAFDPRLRDTSARDHAAWARRWRRSLARRPDATPRALAKSFSASASLPALFRSFPDARVIWLARDPADAIPSALSLITGVLHRRFGYAHLPEALRHAHARRVADALLLLLTRFEEDRVAGHFPADQVLIVPYDDLVAHFDVAMARILAHTGLHASPAAQDAIADLAVQQRARQSGHRYNAASFGLDPEALRAAVPFLLAPPYTSDVPCPPPSPCS